ncbi:MAG: hypothetical protein ACWGMZ_03935, partial [Thermoguttaceae bacterium]
QIGQALLKQSQLRPVLVCTDREPALAVREFVAWPVVLVLQGEQSVTIETDQKLIRIDRAHGGGPNLYSFELGRNRLALPAKAEAQRRVITEQLGELVDNFDLAEPFGRIREAIEEAQQAAVR